MIHIQQNDPCIIHATPGSADWLLVGICGAGMRAFAEMLIDAGQNVTGTDLDSAALAQLGTSMPGASMKRPLGSTFRLRPWDAAPDFGTARPVNVVHSVAVPESCSHLVHAKQLGFPVLSLPVAMGAAMENLRQVCIAGTHGKTTSSGMVWWILNQCGQAPAGFIGGEFCSPVPSGSFGAGKIAVLESCEYRNSFLQLRPQTALLTGIECDHFDCFRTNAAADHSFRQFVEKIPASGTLIVNSDCVRTRNIIASAKCHVVTFGLQGSAEWTIGPEVPRLRSGETLELRQPTAPWGSQSWVIQHHGKPVTELHLAVPGIHNAVNALGALVAAVTEGVSPDVAAQHLSTFSGMRRRFEYRGNWRGIDLIDDYAHHPSAVAAIFRTARDLFPDRRLVAVFEPHQISRTEKLFSEFTRALTPFDECLILPVLAARERASNFQCSQLSASLVRQIFEAGGRAFLMANLDQALRRLDHASRPGDVVITMGAGRTHQIHDEIHRRFFRNSAA